MMGVRTDPIQEFYDLHPYPPPVADLDAIAARSSDGREQRVAHHLIWPRRPTGAIRSMLVAGCGTSQAARYAVRYPAARVVGIDVSTASIDHTRRLATQHGLVNLELHRLPIERVGELGERFDHVVCTGVLHHLADPGIGLARLREVLAPAGAATLMVYARYGRTGVHLVQEYCRLLGVAPSPDEISDLVATLREIPLGHPLSRLLRESRDFLDDDALADALLNPRDQAYSVPELLTLLDRAGMRFGRWVRQAPYLPTCGSISETPHAARLAELPAPQQFAALELFRGTMTTHSLIAFAVGDETAAQLDFTGSDVASWVPVQVPTAVVVRERLPPGAAAALLNSAHTSTDLVMFAGEEELAVFEAIDGERCIGDLGRDAAPIVERLYRHDLVVIDATGAVP